MGQVTHQAKAYPCFCSMKQLGVFFLLQLLDGMSLYLRATPSIKFASTHLYTWVKDTTSGRVI